MKEDLRPPNWDINLTTMLQQGRPLSICEDDDFKTLAGSAGAFESEVLVGAHRGAWGKRSSLLVEDSYDDLDSGLTSSSTSRRLYSQQSIPLNRAPSETKSVTFKDNSRKKKSKRPTTNELEQAYLTQKSKEKRKAFRAQVGCFTVTGTCVGVIGFFLLIIMAIALLMVPGPGRMPLTVPIFIRDERGFLENFQNDSYNYSYTVLKHIRSYARYSFLYKPEVPRTFIAITFNLGYFDDYLSKYGGTVRMLFDRLPFESYFRRNIGHGTIFKLIYRNGGTFSWKVGPCYTTITVSLPNDKARIFLSEFNHYYGFGEVSVPGSMENYLAVQRADPDSIEQAMSLLPSQDAFFPRFSTGSISTLNRTDIRDKLWEFYDSYYSANLITVAIIGNETLDTLQQWAEEIFTAIPNKEKSKPVFNVLPFPRGDTRYIGREIYYQPKSDKDNLKLIFPVNIPDYPNLSYITYLLGYEGKGSLFQYLSTRGYITALVSSISVEAQNFVLVGVYCDLTEKGLKDPKAIVEALFKFIARVNENGIDEKLWQENKMIDNLKFKFKEKEDPASYASLISSNMAKRDDPRDYLDPPSRRIYNETLEREIMSFISPDNFNFYLSSLKLSVDNKTEYGPALDKEEKWYSTPYANRKMFAEDIENWMTVSLEDDLHLPEENIFIPADFRIIPKEGGDLPVRVNNTEDLTVWWYQDDEFNQPKIYAYCWIQPATPKPDVRSTLLSEMLSGMYTIETSASLYPALSVDYNPAVGFDSKWVVWLSGFSDKTKVEKVIETALDSLFELDFQQDDGHFNATVREPIRKDYLNVKNWMPAQLTRRYARMLQDEYLFEYTEALEVIDTLSQQDVKNLRDEFLEDVSIVCSVMGNLQQEQAKQYAEILKTKLVAGGSANVVNEDRLADDISPVFKLPQNKTLIIRKKAMNPEEPNSGVLTQFQIGPYESNGPYADKAPFTRNVLVTLLGLMMREPCFNYLRTQMQLGYVATCFDEQYKDILNFNMLVQGSREDAGADVIAMEMDKFLIKQYETFDASRSTPEGIQLWSDIKLALKKQLEEKPISLSEKASKFNGEIFSPTRDFSKNEKKVAALEEITFDEFVEFFHRYLISDQRRKISSQVYGKQHDVGDEVDPTKGEELITDIIAYRDTLTERFGDSE